MLSLNKRLQKYSALNRFSTKPHTNLKGGLEMTEKHTGKDIRRNASKETPSGQPEPLSGSKKVKRRNQVSQTNGEG